MAPVTFMAEHDEEPMSRTFQYRKVMKPLLERKRRARINACLDELKDIMTVGIKVVWGSDKFCPHYYGAP